MIKKTGRIPETSVEAETGKLVSRSGNPRLVGPGGKESETGRRTVAGDTPPKEADSRGHHDDVPHRTGDGDHPAEAETGVKTDGDRSLETSVNRHGVRPETGGRGRNLRNGNIDRDAMKGVLRRERKRKRVITNRGLSCFI